MKNESKIYQFAFNSETCRIPKVSAVFEKDESNNWGGEDEKGWPIELLEEGSDGYVFDDEWSYFEGDAEDCIMKLNEIGERTSSHWIAVYNQLCSVFAEVGIEEVN